MIDHNRYMWCLHCVYWCLSQGELAISSEMEKLQSALFFDNVPDTWTKLAYPSIYSLAIWCVCLCHCAVKM